MTITDAKDQVLFEQWLSYEQFRLGHYFDVEVPMVFEKGKSYYCTVSLTEDEFGVVPYMPVCSWDTALTLALGLPDHFIVRKKASLDGGLQDME